MEFGEIVLLLCGNFNPITNMHLRMFGEFMLELCLLYVLYAENLL